MEGWQEWLASAQTENDSRAVQVLAPQLARGGPAPIRPTFTADQRKVPASPGAAQVSVLPSRRPPAVASTPAPARKTRRDCCLRPSPGVPE